MASETTAKTYLCNVFSDGHQLITSLPAKLMLIRRPTIYTETHRMARRGQDIILTCLVDSLSNYTAIMWTKEDVPLDIAPRCGECCAEADCT